MNPLLKVILILKFLEPPAHLLSFVSLVLPYLVIVEKLPWILLFCGESALLKPVDHLVVTLRTTRHSSAGFMCGLYFKIFLEYEMVQGPNFGDPWYTHMWWMCVPEGERLLIRPCVVVTLRLLTTARVLTLEGIAWKIIALRTVWRATSTAAAAGRLGVNGGHRVSRLSEGNYTPMHHHKNQRLQ